MYEKKITKLSTISEYKWEVEDELALQAIWYFKSYCQNLVKLKCLRIKILNIELLSTNGYNYYQTKFQVRCNADRQDHQKLIQE